MTELVKLEKHNHLAIITLNRPEAANALSQDLLNQLMNTLENIDENPEIHCTIITGAGEKVFCAGADLKERKGMSDSETVQAVQIIGTVISRIEKMKMPVIAAINGAAFGGGLELALACDIRIAINTAKIGLTETSLAIIPGAGGTQRLPRLIGIGKAKQLIYTAKPVSAEEAFAIGLIEEVAPSSALETALEMGQSIVKNGPIALKQAKLAIDLGIGTDIARGLQIENICYEKTIPTEDRMEGLIAFQEKRKPVYQGK